MIALAYLASAGLVLSIGIIWGQTIARDYEAQLPPLARVVERQPGVSRRKLRAMRRELAASIVNR